MISLDSVRGQLDRKARRVERSFGNRLADELNGTVPVKTGELKRSQTVNGSVTPDRISWTIEATAPHAEAQAYGAAPHVIRPKRASSLAFYWPRVGQVVYFKSVNHPGNPANLWWNRATSEQALADRLLRTWNSL